MVFGMTVSAKSPTSCLVAEGGSRFGKHELNSRTSLLASAVSDANREWFDYFFGLVSMTETMPMPSSLSFSKVA